MSSYTRIIYKVQMEHCERYSIYCSLIEKWVQFGLFSVGGSRPSFPLTLEKEVELLLNLRLCVHQEFFSQQQY